MPEPTHPDRIPAPPMDQFNYALSALGDQTMRMVVAFEGLIDERRLKKALAAALVQIPVLNSRFVEGETPYWERLPDVDHRNLIRVTNAPENGQDLSAILGVPIDPAAGPQIRLSISRAPGGDTLCISVHHAAMDARGLLACTRLVAEYYRNPDRAPAPQDVAGDRSLAAVLVHFPDAQVSNTPAHEDLPRGWAFPGTTGKCFARAFALRILPKESLDAIKGAGHQQGATVTDVVLAAYFRALCTEIQPGPGTLLPVMVSIDLRRYHGCTGHEPLKTLVSNQSVAFPVMLAPETGSFDKAITQAREAMQAHMAHNPGISSAADMEKFGYNNFAGICSRVQATKEKCATYGANTPFLANIGIIPEETVAFSPDLPVTGAYLAGIVIDPPGVALGVTTFRDRLTLVAGYGTPAIPGTTMERFMDRLVRYLPSGTAGDQS